MLSGVLIAYVYTSMAQIPWLLVLRLCECHPVCAACAIAHECFYHPCFHDIGTDGAADALEANCFLPDRADPAGNWGLHIRQGALQPPQGQPASPRYFARVFTYQKWRCQSWRSQIHELFLRIKYECVVFNHYLACGGKATGSDISLSPMPT